MVGREDVVSVLVLIQAGAGLLAMFGELLFMGNPLYLVVPVAKAAVLFVLAAKVVGRRRWALIALLTFEGLSVLGVSASTLVGLLPGLDRTMTLTGLLTEVGIPLVVIVYCAQLLAAWSSAPARPSEPTTIAVDPWAEVAR